MAAYTDIISIIGGAASNSYVSGLRPIHLLLCSRGAMPG